MADKIGVARLRQAIENQETAGEACFSLPFDEADALLRECESELPRGKDGRPINVGETVYGEDGRAWHVRGVTIGEKSIAHPEHVIRATSDAMVVE